MALNKRPDVGHYQNHPSGVECVDVVQHYSYNVGTAMAYLWRHREKHEDPRIDIRKAIDHLNFELAKLDKEIEDDEMYAQVERQSRPARPER